MIGSRSTTGNSNNVHTTDIDAINTYNTNNINTGNFTITASTNINNVNIKNVSTSNANNINTNSVSIDNINNVNFNNINNNHVNTYRVNTNHANNNTVNTSNYTNNLKTITVNTFANTNNVQCINNVNNLTAINVNHKTNTKFLTVNLSSITLSEIDLTLLENGLTFIPTPKLLPIYKILENKTRLIRSLKLKYFFRHENDVYDPKIKTFKHSSDWIPQPNSLAPHIHETINNINKITKTIIDNCIKTTTASGVDCIKLNEITNLDKNQFKSLHLLKKLDSIEIKPADKGGAIVIMDRHQYIFEAMRQLNNAQYYRKLDAPIFTDNIPKIQAILNSMERQYYIDADQNEYLSGPTQPRNRIFYLLPKIHKNKTSWTNENMPEGRPIVSDVNSESYRISEFIDYHINKLATMHPSYLKNTYDFVNKIRNKPVNQNSLIVTGDVASLYTNMHIDITIETVKKTLAENPDPLRPDKYLLELLELTLKNNDFEFNQQYFLQICGTAMGKKYAPALANLYLLEFDKAVIAGLNGMIPQYFYRYLDDVYFLWPGSAEDLKQFENHLNTITPGIKITFEYSQTEMNFLDTTICKKTSDNQVTLQTKVYFKKTDTHQLLHVNSFHPKHTTKGILKSQLIRFKRISSSKLDYDNTCKILFNALKKRGYFFNKMKKQQKHVWLKYNEPIDTAAPVLIRQQTLDRFFNPANRTLHYSADCKTRTCSTCKIILKTHQFTSFKTKTNFPILSACNCNSSNLIYLISCAICKIQYVGETGGTLRDRMNNHRSDISLNKNTPIGIHFNLPNHSLENLTVVPIELMTITSPTERRKREAFWQKELVTKYPAGLNAFPIPAELRHTTQSFSESAHQFQPEIIIPIICTYDTIGQELNKQYRQILNEDPFYSTCKFITAYTNHKNIRKYLVHSKI